MMGQQQAAMATGIEEIHAEITDALDARKGWEEKLDLYSEMRHNGLGRESLPWPGAANMHDPLSDTIIGNMKPVDIEQMYATELLAEFIAVEDQWMAHNDLTARWFDWEVKHKTNFPRESYRLSDGKYQNGKAFLYWYWQRKRLCCEYVDPLMIIVPPGTDRINDEVNYADWVVKVERYSVAQFLRRAEFKGYSKEEAEKLASACKEESAKESHKARREGITFTTRDYEILVWRFFRKEVKDEGAEEGDETYRILVRTYCPHDLSRQLRDDFYLDWLDDMYPIGTATAEEKDRGIYSSRGIPERVAPEEAANSRSLNTQSDTDTLNRSGIYSTEGNYNGQQNLKAFPGQIVNGPLKQVSNTPPVVDYDARVSAGRQRAESRVQSYGSSVMRNEKGEKGTAKEWGILEAYGQRGDTMNSRLYRMDLGENYLIAWKILMIKKRNELKYYYQGQYHDLPPEALQGSYHILPNGSGDNFNKQFRIQIALAKLNTFKDNPNIKQGPLAKDVLEAFDPRDVKTLYQDPELEKLEETQRQAQENLIMETGAMVPVQGYDDHAVHLAELERFVDREAKMQTPLAPDAAGQFLAHGTGHLQGLKKKNPEQYKALNKQLVDIFGFLAELASVENHPTGSGGMGTIGQNNPAAALN